MASGPDRDISQKPSCPTCSVANAQTLVRVPPVVYLRCAACATVWGIPDRRKVGRPDDEALERFLPENGDN